MYDISFHTLLTHKRFVKLTEQINMLSSKLGKRCPWLTSIRYCRTFATATDATTARAAALYAELETTTRPAVERHEGPPVAVRQHAERFYETYADDVDPETYGPFINGDRYVVERQREFTTVRGYLESAAASNVALGAQVELTFADRDVLVGEAVATLTDRFGSALQSFYEPHP